MILLLVSSSCSADVSCRKLSLWGCPCRLAQRAVIAVRVETTDWRSWVGHHAVMFVNEPPLWLTVVWFHVRLRLRQLAPRNNFYRRFILVHRQTVTVSDIVWLGIIWFEFYSISYLLPPPTRRRLCDRSSVCLCVILWARLLKKQWVDFIVNLVLWLGFTHRKNWLTFGGDPIPDMDSESILHFSYHCGIGDFRSFISVSLLRNLAK